MFDNIWVAIAVCVLLGLVCVLLWPKPLSLARETQLRPNDTAGVLVVVPRASMLGNIFETAVAPGRVFVAVGEPCDFQTNTRSLSTDASCFGSHALIHLTLTQLRRNEPYTLILGTETIVLKRGWDVLLLDSLVARRKSIVLSAWPAQERANDQAAFPVFRGFGKGGWPEFQAQLSSASNTVQPFEIGLATPECLFGESEIFAELFRYPLAFVTDIELSLLISFELFARGIGIWTPARSVAWKSRDITAPPACFSRLAGHEELRKHTHLALSHLLRGKSIPRNNDSLPMYLLLHQDGHARGKQADFWDYVGVWPEEKTKPTPSPLGRAKLGLLRGFGHKDILHRFSSFAEFNQLRASL